MTKHRKLLFVTDAPLFGGAERYILDMAAAASRRCMAPGICWLRPQGCEPGVFAAAEQCDTQVHHLDSARPLVSLLTSFRNLLRRERPDAIIFNASGRPRFWMLPWVARLDGLRAAWVHHMVDTRDPRRLRPAHLGGRLEGLHAWRVPQTLRHALAGAAVAAVVTSNECDREYVARWHRVSRARLHVISPGIDTHRFEAGRPATVNALPGHPTEFTVGTAARLTAGKGIETLIEAVRLLNSRGLAVRACVAGSGPDEQRLRQLACDRQISHRIDFVGLQSDMPAFYRALDAFSLCSDTESFGLALTEAMACELPVIATATAGARSQIEHLSTGLLLSGATPAALADALAVLHADPDLRRAMGRRARAAVLARFSIDFTLDRTLDTLSRPQPMNRSLPCAPTAPMLAAEDLR